MRIMAARWLVVFIRLKKRFEKSTGCGLTCGNGGNSARPLILRLINQLVGGDPGHRGVQSRKRLLIWRKAAFALIALDEVCYTSSSSRRSAAGPPPADMVLNRMRRRHQKGVKSLLHDSVAFTRSRFEALTIRNLDCSAAVADKSGSLHRLRGQSHRFPVGTQHARQKFVGV